MELLILTAVVVVAVLVYYNRSSKKGLDLNQDGEIDGKDVQVAVENVKTGITTDIVKVKTAAKATAKKVTAKKPAAKKPAAKKK